VNSTRGLRNCPFWVSGGLGSPQPPARIAQAEGAEKKNSGAGRYATPPDTATDTDKDHALHWVFGKSTARSYRYVQMSNCLKSVLIGATH